MTPGRHDLARPFVAPADHFYAARDIDADHVESSTPIHWMPATFTSR